MVKEWPQRLLRRTAPSSTIAGLEALDHPSSPIHRRTEGGRFYFNLINLLNLLDINVTNHAKLPLIMTIMEALQWGKQKIREGFNEGGDNSPFLDAQILLAAVTDLSTAKLITEVDHELKEEEIEKFQQHILRRLKKEPIAYIIGEKEFYKRSFIVNPHVLIPRPDTEILIETALNQFKEEKKYQEEVWFADIGTGSGAIAVTLAAETNTPVIASDLDPLALNVAKQNAKKNNVTELIDFRQGNLLEPLIKLFSALDKTSKNPCQSLIICANLPYLTFEQWKNSEPNVKDFEPSLALIAGHDGLDLYWQLIREIKKERALFPARLSLIIEIDPKQKLKISSLISHDFPTATISTIRDLNNLDRIVVTDLNHLIQ